MSKDHERIAVAKKTAGKAAHRSLLLEALEDGDRRELLARARQSRFDPGASIFLRGEPADALYVIDSGRVEISVTSLNGRKSVLNYMGPGEVLGEVAIFDGGERSADARAASEVVLLALRRSDILGFLAENSEATMALIADLCQKVRNASDMFENQAQVNARMRLARCLLIVARKWGSAEGGGVRLDAGLSQADLGDFSGLARENVNRNLKALEAEGVIRFEGRTIMVCNLEQLEDIAEF